MLAAVALLLSAAPDVVVFNTSVVHVDIGRVERNVDVVVRGERIAYVGPSGLRQAGPTPRVVDGSGKFLIPGLWDMHVHWYHEPSLALFTAHGVTGARIMFGTPLHLEWRKKIAAGQMIGPNLVVGSPIIDGPRPMWPGSWKVSTAEEGREVVARLQREGYEFAKVYGGLSGDAFRALVDEAKMRNVPVVGHIPDVRILEASAAGMKCIEHLDRLLVASSSRREEFQVRSDKATDEEWPAFYWRSRAEATDSYNAKYGEEFFSSFVRNGNWHCPTLLVNRQISRLKDAGIANDPRMRYLPQNFHKMWAPQDDFRFKTLKQESFDDMKKGVEGEKRLLLLMQRAGVGILAGTDSGNPFCFPGSGLHEELQIMVDAGLTPLEALRTATLNPARYFERPDIGVVKADALADLVLLDANPLEKIENAMRVRTVIQRGRVFTRRDLDALLLLAEKAAAKP